MSPDPHLARQPSVVARLHRALLWDYSPRSALFWALLVGLGSGALAWALLRLAALLQAAPGLALPLGLGVACAALAALLPLRLPFSKHSLTVGDLFSFGLLLLVGAPAAVLAVAAEAAVGAWRSSGRASSRLASPALAALAMAVVGSGFEALVAAWSGMPVGIPTAVASAQRLQPAQAPLLMLFAMLAMGLAYAAVNSLLFSAVLHAKQGQWPTPQAWLARFGSLGVVHAASAAVSLLAVLAAGQLGMGVLLAAAPVVAALLLGLRLHFQVVQLHGGMVQARAEAAEALADQAAVHLRDLRRSEQRFSRAFQHAAIGMALVDNGDRIVQVNPALATLLGQPIEALAGRPLAGLFSSADGARLATAAAAVRAGSQLAFSLDAVEGQHPQGQPVWLAASGSLFAENPEDDRCLVLQLQDITARRQAETRLQHVAWHDSLTGLPNRGRFMAALAEACAQHASGAARFALMFLDFDRFKLINDGLGHNVGDAFLCSVAERIQAQLRPGDLVARLGGDEFALLLTGIPDVQPAVALAERLQAMMRCPVQVLGHELATSASIGIRLAGGEPSDPTDLLRDADTAMYRAKADGKNGNPTGWSLFDTGMQARVSQQLLLEGDLRRAIAADQIDVVFQPLYHLRDARLIGFEALARWLHPQHGAIAPARFVALAEEAGLVTLLTQRVLAKACAGLQAIVQHSAAPLRINVNISALDLCQRGFVEQVSTLLLRHQLKPQQLSLELTEATLMQRLDGAMPAMQALRDLGVTLCVDDFGTGYSSLALLSSLPIGCLKIDARCVQQLMPGQEGAEIVRAIIQIGEALGKSVIAEGIENTVQLRRLMELGCDEGQGYLLSHPERGDALDRLLGGGQALRDARAHWPPGAGTLQ